ncbi:Hint domain-containing protein [Aliiroseovarius sp.]|uniref:Hint domain-containing protein n=1 Tax=Aliiroseovarius sp. TaxID=1872442 RepID=UPI003BAC0463
MSDFRWKDQTPVGEGPAKVSQMHGFAAGSIVATHLGWRPVEALTTGDYILTFDNGMQPITAVTRGAYWLEAGDCPDHLLPIAVPAGVLGNDRPMTVLPEQSVMVESDAAEELLDDPFALIPAEVLLGFKGIDRMRPWQAFDVVTLHFAQDQVIYADGGALVFCPAAIAGVASVDFMCDGYRPMPYRVLDRDRAELLAEVMGWDEDDFGPSVPMMETNNWQRAATHVA